MPAQATYLGAGTLTLTSPSSAEMDFSCQVQNCVLTPEIEQGDSVFVLCGDEIAGDITTTHKLSGTLVLDPYEGGSGEFLWNNHTKTCDFTFVPNLEVGLSISGKCVVVRPAIGADEYGALLTSDFEWSAVGEPVPTWASVTP